VIGDLLWRIASIWTRSLFACNSARQVSLLNIVEKLSLPFATIVFLSMLGRDAGWQDRRRKL